MSQTIVGHLTSIVLKIVLMIIDFVAYYLQKYVFVLGWW